MLQYSYNEVTTSNSMTTRLSILQYQKNGNKNNGYLDLTSFRMHRFNGLLVNTYKAKDRTFQDVAQVFCMKWIDKIRNEDVLERVGEENGYLELSEESKRR